MSPGGTVALLGLGVSTFPPIAHPGCAGHAHDAVLYGSDDELLEMVVPFLTDGAKSGEPTLVAMDAIKTAMIQDVIGQPAGITFFSPGDYQRPATSINTWFKRFQKLVNQGATQIRAIGEIPTIDVNAGWRGWASYESAINHAFEKFPLWGLCAYDTRLAGADVLQDVARTHPRLLTRSGDNGHNPHYEDPVSFLATQRTAGCHLVRDTTPEIVLLDPTSEVARRAAGTAARSAGLSHTERQDLELALTELTTNAYLHGQPPVTVEMWWTPGSVIAAVSDSGAGPSDPLVGLVPVSPAAHGGRGLWITNQICDAVSLTATPDGFTARFAIGVPLTSWRRRATAPGPR